MELVHYVGNRIRELRNGYGGGRGVSQEELAKTLKTTANTISRWETGTYRPSLDDLDAMSRFFGVSILAFFPSDAEPDEQPVTALLRAARDLPKEDIEELQKYAEFRKARAMFGSTRKTKGRRPHGDQP